MPAQCPYCASDLPSSDVAVCPSCNRPLALTTAPSPDPSGIAVLDIRQELPPFIGTHPWHLVARRVQFQFADRHGWHGKISS